MSYVLFDNDYALGAGGAGGVMRSRRSATLPVAKFAVAQERDPPGACGAGDVLELLQLFYSFPSRNLVWKMITYSRDVPVGTLRTVRGARPGSSSSTCTL